MVMLLLYNSLSTLRRIRRLLSQRQSQSLRTKTGAFVNQVIATATDPDGDALLYTVVQGDDGSGAPDGTAITSLTGFTGIVLSGNTMLGTLANTDDVAETTFHVVVTATDDNNNTATGFSIIQGLSRDGSRAGVDSD